MILAKTMLHSMIRDAVHGVLCLWCGHGVIHGLIRGAVHRVHDWSSPEFMTTARGGACTQTTSHSPLAVVLLCDSAQRFVVHFVVWFMV